MLCNTNTHIQGLGYTSTHTHRLGNTNSHGDNKYIPPGTRLCGYKNTYQRLWWIQTHVPKAWKDKHTYQWLGWYKQTYPRLGRYQHTYPMLGWYQQIYSVRDTNTYQMFWDINTRTQGSGHGYKHTHIHGLRVQTHISKAWVMSHTYLWPWDTNIHI